MKTKRRKLNSVKDKEEEVSKREKYIARRKCETEHETGSERGRRKCKSEGNENLKRARMSGVK